MGIENIDLEEKCLKVRQRIAKCGYASGRGHISSSLSIVEILVALYFSPCINLSKIKNNSPNRDRVILSKGHAGLALYATLIEAEIVNENVLEKFALSEGLLATHPVCGSIRGIEMSAGSLGQGIGFACGVALSEKMKNCGYKTYVIVGDGELQEGSNWESILFAAQMKLNKLTLFVDKNQLQISGKVNDIVSIDPLREKLEAFGFDVLEVDGHNLTEIARALEQKTEQKPKAIIANTTKGKGISFIENQNGWHGKGLTFEQYQRVLKEWEQ